MKDIESTILACQQVKDHPSLNSLKEIVSGYRQYDKESVLFNIVKNVERLIDPDNFPEDNEVKRTQRLYGYMGYVANLKEEHTELSNSLEHIIKVTKSFMPGLFAYLRCPQLPVTNNDMEIFHRKVKTSHRRRTGRKSSHDYILRYGKFAVYQIGIVCLARIKSSVYSKLKSLKEQLHAVRCRYSKMYQVRHHRSKFLKGLLNKWKVNTTPDTAPT